MAYWCLHGLDLLNVNLEPYRTKAIDTLCSMQNQSGGFGGNVMQQSHTATTYAAALSLAVLGKEGYDKVDRIALYRFFYSLKDKETGAFAAHIGG